MAGSSSEREIRDYAAGRLREMYPGARIIHELVVRGCRADLAAVTERSVALVEIKSERDTLKRLPEQARQFSMAAHQVIVIAHERWFDKTPYNNGNPRFVPSAELRDGSGGRADIWAYPETPDRGMYGAWRLPSWHANDPEPRASELLGLLWRQELLVECGRHRISCSSRSTCPYLIREMAWHMTGREIVEAVCRQLRQRHFPEADAPIIEQRSLAA